MEEAVEKVVASQMMRSTKKDWMELKSWKTFTEEKVSFLEISVVESFTLNKQCHQMKS